MGVIRNYTITAARNLAKSRLYTAINIAGLAIGLTATIMIALFVQFESSYDDWLPGVENVHRLEAWSAFGGPGEPRGSSLPAPLLPALKNFVPEIEDGARVLFTSPIVRFEGASFYERVAYADPSFADLFQLPMIEGDLKTALGDASSIVLSHSMARKYFGDEPAIGKLLNVDGKRDFRVAAIMRDLPENSHFDFDILAAFDPATRPDHARLEEHWNWGVVFTYVRIADGTDVKWLERQVLERLDRGLPNPGGPGDNSKLSDYAKYYFTAVRDVHLHTQAAGGTGKPAGSFSAVTAFAVIALLILLIASINFINLATAKSMQRAKEVGLRKIMGASRGQLIWQFLAESVFLTGIALVIALALVEVLLPAYNDFVGLPLVLDLAGNPLTLPALLGLIVLVGVIGGLYPAFYLSAHRPASVIRSNKSAETAGTSRLRASLVVVQFAISIALIIVTAVIYAQTRYALGIDLGFDRSNVMVLRGLEQDGVAVDALHDQLRLHPLVTSVSNAMNVPADEAGARWRVARKGASADNPVFVTHQSVDYEFFHTMKIDVVAGRTLSPEFGSDSFDFEREFAGPIVINEMAVRALGFASPEEAIGQRISMEPGASKPEAEIVGVVRDIHFRSIREGKRPWMFYYRPGSDNVMAIRYRSIDTEQLAQDIRRIWNSAAPGVPLRLEYLEDNIDAQYRTEANRATMFAAFSVLAVLIASLGLFGLAAYSTERRTREIGIRKVLGATISEIVRLLIWQFSLPVLLANAIAWPLAWYYARDWLNGFEYRVDLGATPFILASLLAVGVAWATVAHHAVRVARSRPVDALRYE